VDKPSGKKETSNTREALMLVMDQVKILLENLQMVDPSVIFLPHKANDRAGVESDITEEHIHDKYDFMRKYFPQLYVHKYDTYMYSNVFMAFDTAQENLLRESTNILYQKHHIKSNIIHFNCACATLVCLNQNKQNGSHNTALKELGLDQFSPLLVLRPRIQIKYTSLIGLVMLPKLCIALLSSPKNVYYHNLDSLCCVCPQHVSFERREASRL
jgi:hypothetical protein